MNIHTAETDVQNFILDPRELDIWSNDYFLMLADKIKVKK